MPMVPLLMKTDAAGNALLRCPDCAATSDAGGFSVDAADGTAECRNTGRHSLPVVRKLAEFDPKSPPKQDDSKKPKKR